MHLKNHRALPRRHRIAVAGVAALGISAIAFSAVPSSADTAVVGDPAQSASVVATGAAFTSASTGSPSTGTKPDGKKADLAGQFTRPSLQGQAQEIVDAQKKAAEKKAEQKRRAAEKAAAAKKAAQRKAAEKKAAAKKAAADRGKKSSSRSAARSAPRTATSYPNNLDGWIREALAIMKERNIPGSYHGLYRNIMRESSGNPHAINNWDVNAKNGTPSIGLLQIIKPTFDAYHVPGTPRSQYDPVANIVASANYAAHRYGSIDNVNSAY